MKKRILQSGLSLMEVLIVTAIITLLIVGLLALLRPQEQFAKANDARRKNDLNELRKILEDWYSNTGCYPKKNEICYNNLSGTTCEICTSNKDSPSLANYTSSVICDPEPTLRNYLYQIQGDINCPGKYLIYTKLAATYDKTNDVYSCGPFHGCGPIPSYGYDYLVSSPNADLPVPSTNYYCIRPVTFDCGSCSTYTNCLDQASQQGGSCYDKNKIYPSRANCCNANPGACS